MDDELDLGDDILLKSVKKSGIPLPKGVSSIQTLIQTPGALFSICARSLHQIDNSLLPGFIDQGQMEEDSIVSLAEKFNLCKQMSDGFEKLGFAGGQISFHQFMYPSKEDLYSLLRFLVERLSDVDTLSKDKHREHILESVKSNNTAEQVSISATPIARSGSWKSKEEDETQYVSNSVNEQASEPCASGLEENLIHQKDTYDTTVEDKVSSLSDQLSKLHDVSIQRLEEKEGSLDVLLREQKTGISLTQENVQEIERETEAIIFEIRKREEEQSKLKMELENRPKTATRKSYIQRISEITKNSRKQDKDIERILKDTRDLQIESNTLQERLHRTYAVADETISREMKKDPVRQQAYRLITTIHESFAQISEKILMTDRLRREVAGVEEKLAAAVSSRNVNMNIEKLQADLDSMRKENELLEKQLHRQAIFPQNAGSEA
ncbi:hypothetical protein ACHQM5_002395 [Ranunculus cassubicifolius]